MFAAVAAQPNALTASLNPERWDLPAA